MAFMVGRGVLVLTGDESKPRLYTRVEASSLHFAVWGRGFLHSVSAYSSPIIKALILRLL
jgi:hypothetical protein